MNIKLHNTLTGRLEEFKPIKSGEVGMYHCGPTVYDYAHIGNLRSYIFADILRRTFEYLDFEVRQVINITDIGHLTSDADTGDDKMVKGLKRDGLPLTLDGLRQLTDKYEKVFKDDLDTLNVRKPLHFPRATDYLKQEIDLIRQLEEKGYTYKIQDGIYFDTGKLTDYGKLGGLTPLSEGSARLKTDGKKSDRDFVLWKLSKDGHLGFESPWGMGFPGWHIECSAMSRELLAQPFDIHTGGMDHIPVHHNNEIAQSEAAYDTPLANFWLHNEFITVTEGKMAKSLGNQITLNTLIEKGFSPLAYRYFLLMAHYRTPVNFSWEALEAAQNAYRKLKEAVSTWQIDMKNISRLDLDNSYAEEFKEAIENDLNTPEALAVVWKLVKDESVSPADKRTTLLDFDKVLGLNLENNEFEVKNIPKEVEQLLKDRESARVIGNYSKSDQLREQIKNLGFIVEDTISGQKISKS
ncbi:MAG: cysteine--tRNA ligase [bacterium]|nr:cysteine--tRNA ligase [bacterium]